jgi:hypothetical protein
MIARKSLQEALQDQVSQHAPLSEWIEATQDEKLWNDIIDEWYEVTWLPSQFH